MFSVIIDIFLIGMPIIYYLNNLKEKHIRMKEKVNVILEKLGLANLNRKTFSNTIVLLFVLLVVTILLEFILNFFGLNDIEKAYNIIRSIKENYLLIAYLLTVRVIAEEVFFRGFLVKETGIIVSSILFSLMHIFYYSFAELVGALVLGFILAGFYAKQKDLYANITAHALYNLYLFINL